MPAMRSLETVDTRSVEPGNPRSSPEAEHQPASSTTRDCPLPAPDSLITAARAAVIAGCSIWTIRRAYKFGALRAHRDGNGRSVRIRFGDLEAWMTDQPAAEPRTVLLEPPRAVERSLSRRLPSGDNLALLRAGRDAAR
jgi:excisionase family DNA binding protein